MKRESGENPEQTRCCKLKNPQNLLKGRFKEEKRIEQTYATDSCIPSFGWVSEAGKAVQIPEQVRRPAM